jgi:hypothetical protein
MQAVAIPEAGRRCEGSLAVESAAAAAVVVVADVVEVEIEPSGVVVEVEAGYAWDERDELAVAAAGTCAAEVVVRAKVAAGTRNGGPLARLVVVGGGGRQQVPMSSAVRPRTAASGAGAVVAVGRDTAGAAVVGHGHGHGYGLAACCGSSGRCTWPPVACMRSRSLRPAANLVARPAGPCSAPSGGCRYVTTAGNPSGVAGCGLGARRRHWRSGVMLMVCGAG